MENEPIVEVGTIQKEEAQHQTINVDDALLQINRNLGAIIGKLYEFFPVDVAMPFANDIGMNIESLRHIADAVKKEKAKAAEEPLVPEFGIMEVKEGEEPDGTAVPDAE
jgi:hypothetical protein